LGLIYKGSLGWNWTSA